MSFHRFFALVSPITIILSSIQSELLATNYDLSNTTISNQTSQGGSAHNGGGGAGLGGGVFVYHSDTLTLTGVTFEDCRAIGGAGDNTSLNVGDSGGGGGFSGGTGGDGEYAGGGGGFGVIVSNVVIPGQGGHGSSIFGNGTDIGGGGGGFGDLGDSGIDTTGGNGNSYTGPGGAGGASGEDGEDGNYYGDGGGGGQYANGGRGGGGGFNYQSTVPGGLGGFGGGGGVNYEATEVGGTGGFGGGGGIAIESAPSSGNGGFGGGAGNGGGIPGFGGGGAHPDDWHVGGGGGGLGGALFLHSQTGSAATCTISGHITFQNNSAQGGSGFESGSSLGQDIFMMSGSHIIVENLTTNSTVPSAIESDLGAGGGGLGIGGLTLDTGNTAVFTLYGDNTYTGKTTVNSGTLDVQGTLITPVILIDGVFGGNVSLLVNGGVPSSGDLTVHGGMLAPGGDTLYGTINVGNNLLFMGGGVFDAEVDSVGNTDSISASGTATLTGTLDIQAAVGNFLKGEVITILDATGGVNGAFLSEIIPLHPNGGPLFEVQYNANSVDLLVLEDLVFDTASTGQTIHSGNPQTVVDYMLAQLPIDPTSDFGFVIESLGLIPKDQINKALNLMHPGSFALLGSMNLTTNAQIMEVFSGHFFGGAGSPAETISQLEPTLTAAAGDQPFYSNTPVRRGCNRDINNHHNVWLQPFGTWNTQGKKGEQRGVNYESAGIMTGYDYLFENFYVGAGLGYAYTNFRWQGTAGKGHINQVYGGLTGSYFMKYFAATLSTMVGGNYYNTDRYIRYNAPNHPTARLSRTAHSHSSGIQWTNHLGLIGDFSPLSVPLQIFANLDHFYLHNGSFSESGANSLNMRVNAKTSNALRSELGLSSSYSFKVEGGCWTPYARISWVNKTLLSSSSYRGGFRGQTGTFSVSASSKGSNQWAPGVGVEFANVHGFSLLVNTRAELSGKMKNYSADMRMDYTF